MLHELFYGLYQCAKNQSLLKSLDRSGSNVAETHLPSQIALFQSIISYFGIMGLYDKIFDLIINRSHDLYFLVQ